MTEKIQDEFIKEKISETDLDNVNGGTFTPNTYDHQSYNYYGITTDYSFFSKDKFYYKGKEISYDMANKIVEIGNDVYLSLNSGYYGKDKISRTEPAFIRAFNLQLKLQLGPEYMWDGTQGKHI